MLPPFLILIFLRDIRFFMPYRLIMSILSLYTMPATFSPNTIDFTSFSDVYFLLSHPVGSKKLNFTSQV